MKLAPVLIGGTVLATVLSGCGDGGSGSDPGALQVVVGFYPLQYLGERIGGAEVEVTSLAQPGAEPHDLELAPQQIEQIAEADLVLVLGGFQPAVDDAVAQNAEDSSFDVLAATSVNDGYEELGQEEEGEEHEEPGADPHVWLDPTKYAELATAVADRLAGVDPDNASTYQDNAAALVDDLTDLDGEFEAGLADCERSEIVTTHNAFGYLADRYGLEQVGIAGLSPDDEPSPQTLEEVQAFAQANGITTIFYEDAVSPDYAETIATEIGADTAVLSPLEVVDEGEDYLSVMRTDLATLQTALGCG